MAGNSAQKDMQLLTSLSQLSPHSQQLAIDNSRLTTTIKILKAQIQQKNNVIIQLKNQLDSGVIEHTQQKLSFSRSIQTEVEFRVQQIRQNYQLKIVQNQQRFEDLQQIIHGYQQKLGDQINRNCSLHKKIEALKQYISDVIEEKDFLINQLGKIISSQQCNSIHSCKCLNQTQLLTNEKQKKRKNAVIRRNE